MEVKTSVEEKRVKSTVIRRRAKVEEAPPAPEVNPTEATSQKSSLAEENKEASLKTSETKPLQTKPSPSTASSEADLELPVAEEVTKEKQLLRKVTKRKSRDELEMEMIERAGGLKKAAELITTAPERLERVFKPERSSKKRKLISRKEYKKTELTTPKAAKRVLRIEGAINP